MPSAVPTIRALAKQLGLSRTTVSEALRGLPRIQEKTAIRIREAANLAGYRPNPLASAVMSQIRRSRTQAFRGGMAAVTIDEADRPSNSARYHEALIEGARARAADLGYKLQAFLVGQEGVTVERLDSILQSRGIQGVLLLPAWRQPDLSRLDWSRYAGIYMDYMIERPALHSIASDHFRSLTGALQRLEAMGYRRPGLFLHRHQDERLQHRWEGAFLAHQRSSRKPGIPPLIMDEFDRVPFMKWFRRHGPDVVLGHWTEAIEWMAECGAKVPEEAGFVSLNVTTESRPCAGLDLRPELLGARSVELLIAQLQRNERGIPAPASLTVIPALWRDGPTLVARA
ncbi:MAG TPA: LacI family DNA-binding transcriptional regulator [Opitutaceae bacterium]|nr:LacI family DNA-binding transcriptional regulator [Opitutaceae bacterium]